MSSPAGTKKDSNLTGPPKANKKAIKTIITLTPLQPSYTYSTTSPASFKAIFGGLGPSPVEVI